MGLILFSGVACQLKELTSAKVHIRQNHWNAAVAQLEKAVTAHPENAEAQFLLGRGYAIQMRFTNMNRAFAASLAASSQFDLEIKTWRQKYFSEYFNVGVKAFSEKNLSAARDAFLIATAIDPKHPGVYRNLAYVQARLGEFGQALGLYQSALEINPDDGEAYVAIAEIHRQQHDYKRGETVLEQALQKNPRQPQILAALAVMYECLGKSEDAFAAYQQALQIKPDDKELLLNLARLYLSKNDYANAIQQYANVLSLDPDNFEACYHIGLGYLKMGERLQKRASELKEQPTTKPFAGSKEKTKPKLPADSSESVRLNLEARRNFKTAAPFLLKAAALDTLHAGAYFNLGVGFTRLGETAKAEEAFKRYEQLQEKR